jgi:C-terminal processing protease CtpA/Prc
MPPTRHLHTLTLLALLSTALLASAADDKNKGWFGLTVSAAVEGTSFNPALQSITIAKVMPSSPAAAAGLVAGDQIVEIQGMTIPGATAKEVRGAMHQNVGASLHLTVKHGAAEPKVVTLIAVAKP